MYYEILHIYHLTSPVFEALNFSVLQLCTMQDQNNIVCPMISYGLQSYEMTARDDFKIYRIPLTCNLIMWSLEE